MSLGVTVQVDALDWRLESDCDETAERLRCVWLIGGGISIRLGVTDAIDNQSALDVCRRCKRRLATKRHELPNRKGEWTSRAEPVCDPCFLALDELFMQTVRGVNAVDRAVRGCRGNGHGEAA